MSTENDRYFDKINCVNNDEYMKIRISELIEERKKITTYRCQKKKDLEIELSKEFPNKDKVFEIKQYLNLSEPD